MTADAVGARTITELGAAYEEAWAEWAASDDARSAGRGIAELQNRAVNGAVESAMSSVGSEIAVGEGVIGVAARHWNGSGAGASRQWPMG